MPFLSNSVTQVFTIRTELSVGRIRRSAPPIHLAILRSITSIILLAAGGARLTVFPKSIIKLASHWWGLSTDSKRFLVIRNIHSGSCGAEPTEAEGRTLKRCINACSRSDLGLPGYHPLLTSPTETRCPRKPPRLVGRFSLIALPQG